MKNRILLTVLSLMVLTACNNQQEVGDTTGQMPVSAGVSGMISQEAASRMTNDTWEEEDAIGISGTSGDVTYTNRRHNFTGGSSFTPAPGAVIYYIDEEESEFSAYYPYTASGHTLLEANISNQTGSKNFDYLYATAKGSLSSPMLNFNFYHTMCKVVLNFIPGTGFAVDTDFSGCTVRLASLHASGSFDTLAGIAQANTATARGLEFTDGSTVAANANTYSFILFPETVSGGAALSLIHNGTAYEGVHLKSKDSSDLALTGGKVYEYNVKVNRTGLAVSSYAIHGWNDELPDKDIDINL
jgi:hypothetical protein